MTVDPAKYRRPADEEIKRGFRKRLHMVAVESGTEPSFNNEYWDHMEKGI